MYSVTRQRENCGLCQRITVGTIEEARRAFDIAVDEGDIFAEIYDESDDCQVLWHLTPAAHRKF